MCCVALLGWFATRRVLTIFPLPSADVGKQMDEAMQDFTSIIDPKWRHLGESKQMGTVEKVAELLTSERFKAADGR